MIQIDRISMHLPAGFEHRATSIARLLGDVLAKKHIAQDVSLKSLSITPPHFSLNTSDSEIAQHIAEQIISANGGGK